MILEDSEDAKDSGRGVCREFRGNSEGFISFDRMDLGSNRIIEDPGQANGIRQDNKGLRASQRSE